MHAVLVHPVSPDPHAKAKLPAKKQVQIVYAAAEEQLRIVLETEESMEIVRLIQDYMKGPYEVGWDAQNPRPKSLRELREAVRPIEVEDATEETDCYMVH